MSAEERARVQACVREGTKMTDPKLQPFVVGYIARARRALHRRIALVAFQVVVIVLALVATRTIIWPVYLVALLVLELVLIPWRVRKEVHSLDRAEHAQRPTSSL